MKVFLPLVSSILAEKFDLNGLIDSLNDLNTWADEVRSEQIRRSDGGEFTELPADLDEFQVAFENAAKFGATRKEVKELEQKGRRMLLDDMVRKMASRGNKKGFDISQLSGYGCYGTPIDRHNKNWVGKGKPVDLVDEVNYRLTNCYKCLKMDHPQFMCDGTTPYKVTNRAAGIKCQNDEGSCKRGTCECDAAFIDELSLVLDSYNPDFHIDNGFDRVANCQVRPARGGDDKVDRAISGAEKDKHPTKCCGVGLERVVFKINRFECCSDGTVREIGEC